MYILYSLIWFTIINCLIQNQMFYKLHTHTHTYIYINKLKHAHKYCESINICSVRYFRDQYETAKTISHKKISTNVNLFENRQHKKRSESSSKL